MIVKTTRFGQITVQDDRIITFPRGLLGFSQHTRYALIQPGDGYFFWLQAIDAPDVAFVVTDPNLFVPDYRIPLRSDQLEEMGVASLAEVQVLVIVNKRGHVLTGNLQGPLVIHRIHRTGQQLVLADRRFHTRVPLVDLTSPVKVASA
jgi:flagellar assembly factor FliW